MLLPICLLTQRIKLQILKLQLMDLQRMIWPIKRRLLRLTKPRLLLNQPRQTRQLRLKLKRKNLRSRSLTAKPPLLSNKRMTKRLLKRLSRVLMQRKPQHLFPKFMIMMKDMLIWVSILTQFFQIPSTTTKWKRSIQLLDLRELTIT